MALRGLAQIGVGIAQVAQVGTFCILILCLARLQANASTPTIRYYLSGCSRKSKMVPASANLLQISAISMLLDLYCSQPISVPSECSSNRYQTRIKPFDRESLALEE